MIKNSAAKLIVSAFFLFGCVSVGFADEIDTLQARVKAYYLATISYSSAGSDLSSQNSDGSWSDLDYSDVSISDWRPRIHLSRLRSMSVAYNKSGSSYYQSASMKAGILKGLDFWFVRKPVSNNSWQQVIGQPLKMMKILLLMESELSTTQIQNGIDYSDNGIQPTYYSYPNSSVIALGANLVDITEIHINLSILDYTHNLTDLNRAFGSMSNEIAVSDSEGVRQDFAFHQHGYQLYNSGYGLSFMKDISYWMIRASGLSFSFSQANIDIFSSLILDGSQWMIRRDLWDHAVSGRSISRSGHQKSPDGSVISVLDDMIAMNTSRITEFAAFKDHILGANDGALVGNKHFWLSDYQSHRRSNYYVGIRMCSERVHSHEEGNGENLQGYYLSQGAMMILQDGLEYDNIYPIWDWGRIPGTTTPHKDPAPQPDKWRMYGEATFAGGVSNGTYGAAGFDYNWYGSSGKKAWFLFDDEVVCLGTELSGTSSQPIYSNINQVLKRGDITVSYDNGSGNVVGTGEQTLTAPKWVYHDNVGYLFPDSGNIKLKNSSQSGSWQEIRSSSSSSTITEDVFSLWFDHGIKPSNKTYEYILVPGKTKTQVQTYAAGNPVRVIQNTPLIQAVRNDSLGVTGIVFYAAGEVTITPGQTVQVDKKCIVLVDESKNPVEVTVAHPENLSPIVEVALFGGINDILYFNLPTGRYAGSSLTLTVSGTTNLKNLEQRKSVMFRISPNPFKPITTITYQILKPTKVRLEIYNLAGKQISTLVNEIKTPGSYIVQWNASEYSSGIYLIRLKAGKKVLNKRAQLLK